MATDEQISIVRGLIGNIPDWEYPDKALGLAVEGRALPDKQGRSPWLIKDDGWHIRKGWQHFDLHAAAADIVDDAVAHSQWVAVHRKKKDMRYLAEKLRRQAVVTTSIQVPYKRESAVEARKYKKFENDSGLVVEG